MKNKRAFTLIEVIGVIATLGLILLVAVPSMTKTLKRNEQKKYDNYITNLKLVSENYLVDQLQKGKITFNEDSDITYFSLGDIIDAGYIKDVITNPNNDKKISRDTRIKATKNMDSTYSFEVQEYYNDISEYNKDNLIIHYDAVKYPGKNKFVNNTYEVDYDFGTNATWTESGMLFERKGISSINLNKTYSTDGLTVSFNVKSLEDLGSGDSDYTYPLYFYNDLAAPSPAYFGFRKDTCLFYGTVNNIKNFTVLSTTSFPLEKNKNYTLTFVQEDLTTRRVYINGGEAASQNGLSLSTIIYNQIKINPVLYNLKINNMLIYNRALSAQEIKALYNLDKERFGE